MDQDAGSGNTTVVRKREYGCIHVGAGRLPVVATLWRFKFSIIGLLWFVEYGCTVWASSHMGPS